ncbi:hypothetical protein AAF712_011218 [Marasmius tenuissimus]|uniref:Uncharacterized protein n=1 Tax=Marasmius tenuissimus TaxID=585030 RepID=A0ABR2ZLT9_9AGAR
MTTSRRFSTLPSLESSQQTHIDDLVQRNRTLNTTNMKLKEQVESEKSRAKATIHDIQTKWHAEQKQWREACDTLQACHRIAYLRLQGELENERWNVLTEQEANRKEKLARAQRDTTITKFQIRENELERTVEQLEEQVEDMRSGREQEMRAMREKVAELVVTLATREERLQATDKAYEELEDEIAELQKARAEKEVLSDSLSSQLERANLQLDGERTRNTDLERSNDELRRTNEDLKRQIDKWKSLENKGGAETESLRKRKVELEVQVQSLETKLAKREEELEKSKKRVKNLHDNRTDWQERAEEFIGKHEAVEAELEMASKEVAKLKSELNGLRKSSKSNTPPQAGPSRKKPKTPEAEISEDDVQEVADAISVPDPISPQAVADSQKRTAKRQAGRKREQQLVIDDDEVEIREVSPPVKTKGKGKARETTVDRESDQPKTKTRTKPASQPKTRKTAAKIASEETDSEIEEIPTPVEGKRKEKAAPPVAIKATGRRRKATTDDEGDEGAPPKNKRRKPNEDGPAPPSQPRGKSKPTPNSRTSNTTAAAPPVDDSASNLTLTKPKKRKINLYSTTGSTAVPTFDFSVGLPIPIPYISGLH